MIQGILKKILLAASGCTVIVAFPVYTEELVSRNYTTGINQIASGDHTVTAGDVLLDASGYTGMFYYQRSILNTTNGRMNIDIAQGKTLSIIGFNNNPVDNSSAVYAWKRGTLSGTMTFTGGNVVVSNVVKDSSSNIYGLFAGPGGVLNFESDGANKINLSVLVPLADEVSTHRHGIGLYEGELNFDGGQFYINVDGDPGSYSIDRRIGILMSGGSSLNVRADNILIDTNESAIMVGRIAGSANYPLAYNVVNNANLEANFIHLKSSQGILSRVGSDYLTRSRFTFTGTTLIEAIVHGDIDNLFGDNVGGDILSANSTDFVFNSDTTLIGENLTPLGTRGEHEHEYLGWLDGHWLRGVALMDTSSLIANADFKLQGNGGYYNTGLYLWESQALFKGRTSISVLNGVDTTRGVYLYGSPEETTYAEFQDDLTVSTSGSQAEYISGIEVLAGGKADIQKGLFINDNPAITWSLISSGAGSLIDVNTSETGTVQIDGDIGATNGGTLNMTLNNANSWLTAASYTATTTSTSQGVVDMNITNGAVWNMTGNSHVTNLSLSGGRVNMLAPGNTGAFKSLTVEGDYIGGGTLMMNTVLGGDNSATDKLIVEGNTSGHTLVAINNIGGMGAQTVEGIEIVNVAGNSSGTFEKESRIVAGAYDYNVIRRGSNWYLSSTGGLSDPVDPGVPASPEIPQAPVHPGGPSQIRPEFGSYLANNLAANTLFISRLHDRLGETQYTDALTGESKTTSMWIRNVGSHTRFNDDSEQLKTQSNSYVLQLGGDLAQWSSDGLDRWHLGLMAGYANSRSRTTSALNNHHSRGSVDGYSVGLYGTWYANEPDQSGSYVDTWMLYNWFDNTVNGQYQASETYKSKGITAAVEAGYSLKVAESQQLTYWIQPKAQIVWMDVQADDHRERNGTPVKADSTGNLMTSLGVRAYVNRKPTVEEDKMAGIQPFVEANWIHNSHSPRVTMGEMPNDVQGVKDLAELKIGVEGQLSSRLTVWGNISGQVGSDHYSNAQGMVGVKYNW